MVSYDVKVQFRDAYDEEVGYILARVNSDFLPRVGEVLIGMPEIRTVERPGPMLGEHSVLMVDDILLGDLFSLRVTDVEHEIPTSAREGLYDGKATVVCRVPDPGLVARRNLAAHMDAVWNTACAAFEDVDGSEPPPWVTPDLE